MMDKLKDSKPRRAYRPRGSLKVRDGLQSVTLYLEPDIKDIVTQAALANGRTVGYFLSDILTNSIRSVLKK